MINNLAWLLFAPFINSIVFAGNMSLEPSELTFKETNILLTFSPHQQRHVYDVLYKDKAIFKISENLILIINSMLLIADQNKAILLYKIPMSDNIITTVEELQKVLVVPDEIYQFVTVSPDEFILMRQGRGKKKYKLILFLNSRRVKFKIYSYIYDELEKIKLVAQNNNYKIKANLNFFFGQVSR